MFDTFLLREVFREREVDGVKMKVLRTRNSEGYAGIAITVMVRGVKTVAIRFTNEVDSDSAAGTDYENQARELAKLITEIANHPCKLPKEE